MAKSGPLGDNILPTL